VSELFSTFSDFFGLNLQTIQTLNQKSNLKRKEKPPTKKQSITVLRRKETRRGRAMLEKGDNISIYSFTSL
jgi:hypothetical protein